MNILDSFTCISRNVIYSIICKRCQRCYIGQTGRRLGDRFSEHLRDINNDTSTSVALHFNQRDHGGKHDISVTALLNGPANVSCRVSLENRLIHDLGVMSPSGLNNLHSFC